MTSPGAARRRATEGPSFTSLKCPRNAGLENSCELPFGFIWTPMSPSDDTMMALVECPTDALPPVLCLTCLAYMNPHCEMDSATGKWTCPLCGQDNVAPPDEFQEGKWLHQVLKSPIVEYHQPIIAPTAAGEEEQDDCVTYILVVDANLPAEDAQAIATSMESLLIEQQQEHPDSPKVKLGLVVFDQVVAIYQLGLSGVASADVYTPMDDGEEDEEALLERKAMLDSRAFLQEVEPGQQLGSLRRCISAVFGIAVENTSNAEPQAPLSRLDKLQRRKEDRMRNNGSHQQQQAPIESPWVKHRRESKSRHPKRCTGEAIQCALDLTGVGLSPSRTSRILLFTNGCCNAGDFSVMAPVDEASIVGKRRSKRASPDVVDADTLARAVEYFDMTANFALETGVGIDVLCAGANELGLPAYQALVAPSGGYVLPHPSFTTPHLKHNLKFLLQSTFMSRSRDTMEELDAVDEEKAKPEIFVDFRSDSFIDATHLVGPGEILPVDNSRILDNERDAFELGVSLAAKQGLDTDNLPLNEAVELSMTRIRLGRVDPLTSLSVMLQVNDTIEEEDLFAFFQMTSRHVDPSGKKVITRVATRRMSVATDVTDFLSAVDDEAVSVILAKGAVYRALHGREETENTRDITTAGDTDSLEKLAYEAQLDLDCTIQRISGAFRLLGLETGTRSIDLSGGGGGRASQSSLDFAFPPQLAEALHRLYHLRRGSLISPGPMRSMDDRAEMRALYLRFPMDDCISMMAPAMWSTGSLEGLSALAPAVSSGSLSAAMQLVPAETLALWDSSIIAADNHDSLFVWSGKHSTGPQYDSIREQYKEYLLERSKNRFPAPELHMLFDGDSMSRRFTARLAPSHADPEDHQMAHFPALSSLSPESLERLRSRFKFYDSSSDASFRTWFWSVASATNASRTEGLSLCD